MPVRGAGWWGPGGAGRCVGALCALIVLAILAAPCSAAPLSFPVTPTWTTSYYEQRASLAVLHLEGEASGKAGAQGIVILDFGRPAASGGTYGTMAFGGSYISIPAIVAGVKSFISAYYRYAPADRTLDVAVGTNNSCGTDQPCGGRVCGCSDEPASFYAFGANWALAVEQLRSWAFELKAEGGYSDVVRVVGADDAEPAYDPGYSNTYDLLSGYAATAAGSVPAMVDYGSAEQGWSEAELLQVAYGFAPDVPMPQVYYPAQASEWAALLAYAKSVRHVNMTIFGVLAAENPGAAYSEMLDAATRVTAQHAIPWLSTLDG